MSKNKKKGTTTPPAGKAPVVASQPSPTGQASAGNQAQLEQMGPAPEEGLSALLDDVAPQTKKPSKASRFASAANGAMGSAVTAYAGAVGGATKRVGGAMKGLKGAFTRDSGPAPAGLATDAKKPAAPVRTADEVAAETPEEVHARVAAEYGPEIALYLKKHPELTKSDVSSAPVQLEGVKDEIEGAKAFEEDEADPLAKYKNASLDKKDIEALRAFGLSQDEIMAVNLYTTQAAYVMNNVLRGLVKNEKAVRTYLPWCLKLDSALAKLPKEVSNGQFWGEKVDDSKAEGESIDLQNVYRTDIWTDGMASYMQANWKVGAKVADPAFLSATTIKGSYVGNSPIGRTIDVSGNAPASVLNLSNNKKENEVLFRPGTQMQIDSITDVTTNEQVKDLKKYDLSNIFELKNLPQKFDVHMKVVGAPGAPKKDDAAAAPKDKQAVKEARIREVQAILASSPLSA